MSRKREAKIEAVKEQLIQQLDVFKQSAHEERLLYDNDVVTKNNLLIFLQDIEIFSAKNKLAVAKVKDDIGLSEITELQLKYSAYIASAKIVLKQIDRAKEIARETCGTVNIN